MAVAVMEKQLSRTPFLLGRLIPPFPIQHTHTDRPTDRPTDGHIRTCARRRRRRRRRSSSIHAPCKLNTRRRVWGSCCCCNVTARAVARYIPACIPLLVYCIILYCTYCCCVQWDWPIGIGWGCERQQQTAVASTRNSNAAYVATRRRRRRQLRVLRLLHTQ